MGVSGAGAPLESNGEPKLFPFAGIVFVEWFQGYDVSDRQ
jgi:hypothetical protein